MKTFILEDKTVHMPVIYYLAIFCHVNILYFKQKEQSLKSAENTKNLELKVLSLHLAL